MRTMGLLHPWPWPIPGEPSGLRPASRPPTAGHSQGRTFRHQGQEEPDGGVRLEGRKQTQTSLVCLWLEIMSPSAWRVNFKKRNWCPWCTLSRDLPWLEWPPEASSLRPRSPLCTPHFPLGPPAPSSHGRYLPAPVPLQCGQQGAGGGHPAVSHTDSGLPAPREAGALGVPERKIPTTLPQNLIKHLLCASALQGSVDSETEGCLRSP